MFRHAATHCTASTFCRDDFAPFLLPEDESEDFETHFEQYCTALETTAVWGGHLELQALSHALKRQIKVGMLAQDCSVLSWLCWCVCKRPTHRFAHLPAALLCQLRIHMLPCCFLFLVTLKVGYSLVRLGHHAGISADHTCFLSRLQVYAVGMATQSLGDDYAGDDKQPALELCFLRHAFGLGEHYNSTKKQRTVRFSTEHDYYEHEGPVGSGSEEGSEGEEEQDS